MKKLLIVLVAILCMPLCLLSCGEDESSNLPNLGESVPEVLAFTESSVLVELYETATLSVTGANGDLTWRTANPERLVVDQNGVVFGKMAGTVTVYVSDGSTEVSCSVTVINSGYIPMINVDCDQSLTLLKGDSYTFAPYVTYNGARYDDATFVYTASGAITVSENGRITANSVGTGTVTISANWNGVQVQTLTVEIQITVIE